MLFEQSVYIRKELNSHWIKLEHQHGPSFIVMKHQYGRRDVIRSITQAAKNQILDALKEVIFNMTYNVITDQQKTLRNCPPTHPSLNLLNRKLPLSSQ